MARRVTLTDVSDVDILFSMLLQLHARTTVDATRHGDCIGADSHKAQRKRRYGTNVLSRVVYGAHAPLT